MPHVVLTVIPYWVDVLLILVQFLSYRLSIFQQIPYDTYCENFSGIEGFY